MRGSSRRVAGRLKATALVLTALTFVFAFCAVQPTEAYAYDKNPSGAVAKVAGNKYDDHFYYAHSINDMFDIIDDMVSTTNNPLHEDSVTIDLMSDLNTKDYGLLKFDDRATWTINLNGYMINRDEAEANGKWYGKGNGEVIKVCKNAYLCIKGGDSDEAKARIHGGYLYDNDRFWKASETNSANPIYGGLITGGICDDEDGAGGIVVMEGATLDLEDVTVAGNISDTYWGGNGFGGAIFLAGDKAKLRGISSKIMYNHAVYLGGGIGVKSGACDCEVELELCKVSNNFAEYGGGIGDCGINTKLSIKSSTLENNYASTAGGAIVLYPYSASFSYKPSLSLRRTFVTGNTAGAQGGGIACQMDNAKIKLTGCGISGNKASKGGGVYLTGVTNLSLSGGSYISKNEATSLGGGIAVYPKGMTGSDKQSTISLEDSCSINENKANYGGGIYYGAKAEISFDNSAVVENNTALKDGGGIYADAEGSLKNVSVRGNSAGGQGGGVYVMPKENALSNPRKLYLSQRVIVENNYQGSGDSKKVSNVYLANYSYSGASNSSYAYVVGENGGLTQESRIGFSSEDKGSRELTHKDDGGALLQGIFGMENLTNILYADDGSSFSTSVDGKRLYLKDKASEKITAKVTAGSKTATKTFFRGEGLVLKSSDWNYPEYWTVKGFNGLNDEYKLTPSGDGDQKCVKLGAPLGNSYTVEAHYKNLVTSVDLSIDEETAWSKLKEEATGNEASADGASVTSLRFADENKRFHEVEATVKSRKVNAYISGYTVGVNYTVTVSGEELRNAGITLAPLNDSNLPNGSVVSVCATLKGASASSSITADTEKRIGAGTYTINSDGGVTITTATIRLDNSVEVTYADYKDKGSDYTRDILYGNKVESSFVPKYAPVGKVFDHWSLDPEGKTSADSAIADKDLTLYPVYKDIPDAATSFSVFYMDGDDAVAGESFDLADSLKIEDPGDPTTNKEGVVYSKEGYTFKGWYTDPELKTPATFPMATGYDASSSTPVIEAKLYMKWERKTIVVAFIARGSNPVSYGADYGKTLSKYPADPTLTGYTFEGWYKDDGVEPLVKGETTFTENAVYVARFKRNDYEVKLDLAGGTVQQAALDCDTVTDGSYSRVVSYGDSLGELPSATKSGYVLAGWKYNDKDVSSSTLMTEDTFTFVDSDAQAAVASLADEGATDADDAPDGQVAGTLTAVWEPDTSSDDSTISVEFMDGEESIGGVFMSKGDKLSQDEVTARFSDDSYKVVGCYADEDCTRAFDFDQALSESCVVYVKREGQPRTITFETGEGASAVASQTVKSGEKLTEPAAPTRSGYTFAGWFTDEELTRAFDFETMVADRDATLYAKWEKAGDVKPDDSGKADDADGKTDGSGTTDGTGDKADGSGTTGGSTTTTTTTTSTNAAKKQRTPNTGDQSFSLTAIGSIVVVAVVAVAAAVFIKRK